MEIIYLSIYIQPNEQQTERQTAKNCPLGLAILAETTAISTAHTDKTVTTGPQPMYPQPTEDVTGNVTGRQRVALSLGMRTGEIF